MLVNAQDIANFFGVKTQSVTRWHELGLPVEKRQARPGEGNEYDSVKVTEWYIKYKTKSKAQDTGSAEKRLKMAKAERAELELGEYRNELVTIQDASDEMGVRIHNAKARLLQLPRVIAQQSRLETGDALERFAMKELYTALEELSKPHNDKFKDVA